MLLLSSLKLGLTVKDVDRFEVGELLDIIITFNNFDDDIASEGQIRKATQKDFDRF